MAAPADKPKPVASPGPQPLPTVLLHHRAPGGDHYDWMIADPRGRGPAARLWTARVAAPSTEWAKLDSWTIEVIAPHRREYLTYEGPVSNNRGSVTRVDGGECVAREWSDRRIVVDLRMRGFRGTLAMEPETHTRWRVTRVT
jgi:hypothetical protein